MDKCALVLCSKTGFGGAERRLLRVYSEIAKQQNGICVIFQSSPQVNTMELMQQMGLDYSDFYSVRCFDTRRQLVNECLTGGYKALHFVDSSLLWTLLVILARFQNIRTLETVASVYLAQRTGSMKFRCLSLLLWNVVDHIDLLYPQYASKVERVCKASKINCTPGTFTDLTLFHPEKKQKLLLFSAARLSEDKGPQILVAALKQIADSIRQYGYQAIIIGRGYQENELQTEIQANHLDDIVQMLGYVSPQDYIPTAEVVFSLQRMNYPSQVVAEACASGCCVIASKNALDPTEFLNESFARFCNRNPQSLAKVILAYLELPQEQKAELQKNARIHAEKYFSIEYSVNYFSGLLSKLTR